MQKSLIYIFLVISFSCQSSIFSSKEGKLMSVLKVYNKPEVLDRKIYITAMVGGCSGCMKVVSDYIKDNITDPRQLFIISCPSVKEVSFIFDYKVRNSPNILIDKQMIAVREELVGGEHPKVYYCKEGKIVKEEEVSSNSAEQVFTSIKTFLETSILSKNCF
jgi:hypothetical protein